MGRIWDYAFLFHPELKEMGIKVYMFELKWVTIRKNKVEIYSLLNAFLFENEYNFIYKLYISKPMKVYALYL